MIETLGSLYRKSGHELPPLQQRGESISGAFPGTAAYEALTFGTPTYTGRSVNPNTAMTYTAVWACFKILCEGVASLPFLTYRNLSADGLVKRLATDDYRYRLLREQPNEEMSSMQWREFVMQSLLGWGNSFNYVDLDGRGRIRQIYPLRPDWMIVQRNPRTMRLEYRYTPLYPFAVPVPAGIYDPEQMLHIPGMGWDGVIGYSPITMCRNAIGLGQAYEEHGGRTFANGAVPRIALVAPQGATIKDPEQVRKEWHKHYGGLENTGSVAILHGGLDVKTFSINPKDAQFLEGRSFQLAEIARIFNVPLGMLHDVMSKPETFASAEQADSRLIKYSIRPWCTRIEQKVNITVLASQDELTCKHDLTDLSRGDLLSQAQAYNTLTGGGIMRRNEARVKLDLDPDPNPSADELTVQQQYVVLGSSSQPKETK
jgi:HK97 family phage portal protein